jgi:hypothetical protein
MNSPKTLRLKTTFGFWSVFVMILGLLACNSSPIPNQQTPEDKAFEEVLFSGTQETQGFIESLNGLVTAPEADFTLAAEAMANASDGFAAWIDDFEQTAADLSAIQAQQQIDLGEFEGVIPEDVKQAATSSFGAVTVRDCIASGFQGPDCEAVKNFITSEANKLAGAVIDRATSYLFGSSPARPSQPTTIKVTQAGESDPAVLLWSFCQDFQAERKCHIVSLAGDTGDTFSIPFLPPGLETVKMVIKVERKSPSVVNIDFQEGKAHVVDVSNPKDPNVTVVELETASCEEITGMASSTDDPDPDPGQTVTVRVFVAPAAKGCKIDYSLVGTDGYLQADTLITDIQGAASFTVPGVRKALSMKLSLKLKMGLP